MNPGPCPLRAPAAHERCRAGRARGLPGGDPASSDRQFLGLVERVLPGWFPHLPDQSQYNRRLRALVELITIVQQRLARWLDLGGARLADGSQLALANYAGCEERSGFAGHARYGYARSQHRFIWGVRLVLLTDERGLPLGYTIVPARRPLNHIKPLVEEDLHRVFIGRSPRVL